MASALHLVNAATPTRRMVPRAPAMGRIAAVQSLGVHRRRTISPSLQLDTSSAVTQRIPVASLLDSFGRRSAYSNQASEVSHPRSAVSPRSSEAHRAGLLGEKPSEVRVQLSLVLVVSTGVCGSSCIGKFDRPQCPGRQRLSTWRTSVHAGALSSGHAQVPRVYQLTE